MFVASIYFLLVGWFHQNHFFTDSPCENVCFIRSMSIYKSIANKWKFHSQYVSGIIFINNAIFFHCLPRKVHSLTCLSWTPFRYKKLYNRINGTINPAEFYYFLTVSGHKMFYLPINIIWILETNIEVFLKWIC